MSEIENTSYGNMDIPEISEEDIEAWEAEREARREAELEPYKALKREIDSYNEQITQAQLALAELYEMLLGSL